MSPTTGGNTPLDELLQELSHAAYHEAPVTYEAVLHLNEQIVVAIADADVASLEKLRKWFTMLPDGDFAKNVHGELTSLRDLMGLLDTTLDIVIPVQLVREVRESQYKRTVVEFLAVVGPSMGCQIAKTFFLDTEEVRATTAWLQSHGFLSGSRQVAEDPGFTWDLTPRGRRLYEAFYK